MSRKSWVITILFLLTLVFMVGCLVGQVLGQDKPKFQPTEVQSLRLQVKQKDAQLAQRDLSDACGGGPGAPLGRLQQAFQQAFTNLTGEAEKIKQENKWPTSTQFDPNTLQFAEPPKPAPPPKDDKKP